MAVRDLLWGCPVCRTAGSIRPDRRAERCVACGAGFRRGAGATIRVARDGQEQVLSAAAWLDRLGPVRLPPPRADGTLLGPETVVVKVSERQVPVRFRGALLGFMEVYAPKQRGSVTLLADGMAFAPPAGERAFWPFAELRGIQPESATIQLALPGRLVALRFIEGSVRLWTRAVTDAIHAFHGARGHDVLECQPRIRMRPIPT